MKKCAWYETNPPHATYLASGKNLWCKSTSRAAAFIKNDRSVKKRFRKKTLRGEHPYLGAHRYGHVALKALK